MKKIYSLLFLTILYFAISTGQAADIPYLTGRVTDNAQILSPESSRSLTAKLKAHEDRTGNQVAVLTIPTLNGQSIEDYAVKVFEAWKLGQKGKDNGILIIVVPNDRRMRIEVGYGLEGTMTDLMSGRIIRDIMTPKFKSGDYNRGISDGAAAVINILEGGTLESVEGQAEAPVSADEGGRETVKSDTFDSGLSITERILFGAFIFGIIGLFTIIGIFTPGMWFLYLFLIPFWAMFPMIVVGTKGALVCLIGYLIVFPVAKILLKNTGLTKKAKGKLESKGKASIGGFLFGASSGSSSWSSGGSHSSGSSGFSGGGGSSGGGGASGRW